MPRVPARGGGRSRGFAAAIALTVALCCAAPASAVVYESEPPFCQPTVLTDYLAPLAQMPPLHSPGGNPGFGRGRLDLTSTPSLVVRSGEVGYTLSLRPKARPLHPKWTATTTLARIDAHGQPVQVLATVRRKLRTISRKRSAGASFQISGEPAFYRVTAVIRNRSGRKVGGFGFYYRVVVPETDAKLALNGTAFRPGQTVFGRIENFGSTRVEYGAGRQIQRQEGSAWVPAPEDPPLPAIAVLYFVQPGLTGRCFGFGIPSAMPPGRYRMMVYPNFAAEFDVLPSS
jgi:hypothetical protein